LGIAVEKSEERRTYAFGREFLIERRSKHEQETFLILDAAKAENIHFSKCSFKRTGIVGEHV
jgi:hypothetical protein